MHLFKSIPFGHGQEGFEIRIYYDEKTINVVAFQNNYPVNGYRYQVKIPKGCDTAEVLSVHPVPELVESCQKGIIDAQWEKMFLKIQDSLTN